MRSLDQRRRVSRYSSRAWFLTSEFQAVGSWSEGVAYQVNSTSLEGAIAAVKAGRVVQQRN